MKKFLLWDHDGVLVDTEYWYFRATQQALAELGVELQRDLYLKRMPRGLSSWELALDAGCPEDEVVRKRQQRDVYYREYLQTEDIGIDGVSDTLAELSRDYRMAIVTTSKGADFNIIHRDRDIVRHMEFVLVREDYVNSKPDPEPYRLALSRFAARESECLVIEDSQRGLQAAIGADIDCAIVYNSFTASQDFTGAHHFLDHITALPGLLREL